MPPLVPPIQRQMRSKWCWAACTVYVCTLYRSHPGITQGNFVARALNRPICQTNFPHPECNTMFDIGAAFNLVGHLAGTPIEGTLSPQELTDRFRQGGRPIGCQIRFPTLGHAVVIVDIRTDPAGRLFLVIADPGSGAINTVPYEMFRTNYLSMGGRWIRTYLTKQQNQS